jgi:hypothetical protein
MKTIKNIFLLSLLLVSFGSIAADCGQIEVPKELLQGNKSDSRKLCDITESLLSRIPSGDESVLNKFVSKFNTERSSCTCDGDKLAESGDDKDAGQCSSPRSFKVIPGDNSTFKVKGSSSAVKG